MYAIPNEFSATSQRRFSPNLATTRESWVKRRLQTVIYEKCPLGSFAPQTRNFEEVKQVPHSEQTIHIKGYTAERYCLFHVVVEGPGSFRYRSTFLYDVRLRSYEGLKVAQFSDFGLFSPYKTRKTYLPAKSLYSPGV